MIDFLYVDLLQFNTESSNIHLVKAAVLKFMGTYTPTL